MQEAYKDPNPEKELNFRDLFVPLTNKKAISFIILVGIIVYFNMLFNGFVWDDKVYLLFNPEVHSFNFQKIFGASIFNSSGYYRSITALYFTFTYFFFHESTFFYHIQQLLLHIANVILIFFFLNKFVKKTIAFFIAIVFLIHPIQVESVSYISSTSGPLFFLFGMIALILSMKEHLSKKRLLLISFLSLLSLLTKETGGLFLIMIILYRFIFNRKIFFVFPIIGSVIVVVYLFLRLQVAGVATQTLGLIPIARLSLDERIINMPAIFSYYLKTFFYPSALQVQQYWIFTHKGLYSFYLPLTIDIIFFLCVGLLGFFIHKHVERFKLFIFFSCWFILGVLLQMQIFPLDMTVADRWFYFPLAGLLGLIAISIDSIKFSSKKTVVSLNIVLVIIIAMLAVRTIVRNTNWSTNLTLFLHDSKMQDNFDIENNLGQEYALTGQYPQALFHYKKSAYMYPYAINLYNVGNVYEKLGNIKESEENYAAAYNKNTYLPISQKRVPALYEQYTWMLLLNDANPKKVVQIAKDGTNEYPDSENLWLYLAVGEYQDHNRAAAIKMAEKAKEISDNPSIDYVYKQINDSKAIKLSK